MTEPQITKLSNGLTVATIKKDTLQNYVSIVAPVGSRHEVGPESGATHFLEHMMADDTENNTILEKEKLVANMRGTWNANTSRERTQYHFRVAKQFTKDAMSLLADSVIRPAMKPERIEKERGAIQAERLGYENNQGNICMNKLYALAFPESGLDQPIIGTQ